MEPETGDTCWAGFILSGFTMARDFYDFITAIQKQMSGGPLLKICVDSRSCDHVICCSICAGCQVKKRLRGPENGHLLTMQRWCLTFISNIYFHRNSDRGPLIIWRGTKSREVNAEPVYVHHMADKVLKTLLGSVCPPYEGALLSAWHSGCDRSDRTLILDINLALQGS